MIRNEKPRGNPINRDRINFPLFLQKAVMGYKQQENQFRHWVVVHTQRDGAMADALGNDIQGFLGRCNVRCAAPVSVEVKGMSL